MSRNLGENNPQILTQGTTTMAAQTQTQWYYAKGGTHYGPVSGRQLQELVAAGKLLPTDLVTKPGAPAWRQANEVKGLNFPTVAAGPVLPPLPGGAGGAPNFAAIQAQIESKALSLAGVLKSHVRTVKLAVLALVVGFAGVFYMYPNEVMYQLGYPGPYYTAQAKEMIKLSRTTARSGDPITARELMAMKVEAMRADAELAKANHRSEE